MWVYRKTEPGLFTVGFYSPDGEWHTDTDHDDKWSAGARVNYLNGGPSDQRLQEIRNAILESNKRIVVDSRLNADDLHALRPRR